jgi:hypothetical protein
VLGRRLLVLLVVLMGLTVLASSVAPRPPVAPVRPPPREARATEAPPPRRASEEHVSAERGRPPARIVVDEGALVTLVVSSPMRGAIALERVEGPRGLDRLDAVDPVSPARFELLADRPGTYRILVVETDREIGTVEVRPG